VGQYPQSAVDVFNNAIQTANNVFENARNQNEINQQAMALNEAIKNFEASVNQDVSKLAELRYLIKQAQQLLDKVDVGTYSLVAYIDLTLARQLAEDVCNQENPSEQDIHTQVVQLKEAIDAFQKMLVAIDDTQRQIKVYAANNTIYVCQDRNDEITIFSIDGKCIQYIANPLDNTTTEIFVEHKGVYFVKVGIELFKVFVK
ncbi:MAG: hypothetical protein IKK40_09400, partial [Bacteroidales bacterium]|nr:hypothetical protein [Bacteroidales bacterium]